MTHVPTVQKWFALEQAAPAPWVPPHLPAPQPGELWLITGPSGAGKSRLLGHLADRSSAPPLDLNRLRLPHRPVVDCLGHLPIDAVLRYLSRVGLAEAHSFLQTPDQLSEGQRHRLRLAMALSRLERGRTRPATPCRLLIADKFAAPLDDVCAAVLARALRRALGLGARFAALVATSRQNLQPALAPDRIIRADFGQYRLVDSAAPGPGTYGRRAASSAPPAAPAPCGSSFTSRKSPRNALSAKYSVSIS